MLAERTGLYRNSNRRPHCRRDGAGRQQLISRHQRRMDQLALLVTRSSPPKDPIFRVIFFCKSARTRLSYNRTHFHPHLPWAWHAF